MGNSLENKFAQIGARAVIRSRWSTWRERFPGPGVRIDIRRDRRGEYFDLFVPSERGPRLDVIDVRPNQRHLLLMDRGSDEKAKFLCGHDERHWFVAAVPEEAHASNVKTAMLALQPDEVHEAVARQRVKQRSRLRRRNAAFLRQGEWFFIPTPDVKVDSSLIVFNEPIARGIGGKPHVVECVYRTGGETVYVSHLAPTGMTAKAYANWKRRHPRDKTRWRTMVRNAGVFAFGKVRHPDHETLVLHVWHRVAMNTENRAKAMRHVVFLD